MKNILNIIKIISKHCLNFQVIAPYQDNTADLKAGYCSLIPLAKIPQTSIGEVYNGEQLTYNQVYRQDFRIYFYKYIDYNETITAEQAAQHLKLWLGSGDAMREFMKHSLNIAPQFSILNIDNYRDKDINKYIELVFFDVGFYINDLIKITAEPIEKINIVNKII